MKIAGKLPVGEGEGFEIIDLRTGLFSETGRPLTLILFGGVIGSEGDGEWKGERIAYHGWAMGILPS